MTHQHRFKQDELLTQKKGIDIWVCQLEGCGQKRTSCCSCDRLVSQINMVGHCIPCANSKGFSMQDPDEGDDDYLLENDQVVVEEAKRGGA